MEKRGVLRVQRWKEEGWRSKVSPVVSKAIASGWCIATYEDSVTEMPRDKRNGKMTKFK